MTVQPFDADVAVTNILVVTDASRSRDFWVDVLGAELYREYGGAVHTVAISIVHDRELAADVVQQTFVKAWRAAATFERGREIAPWLYSIARHTAIDILRAEARPTRGGLSELARVVRSIGSHLSGLDHHARCRTMATRPSISSR